MADSMGRRGRARLQPPVVSSVRKGSGDSYTESSERHRTETFITIIMFAQLRGVLGLNESRPLDAYWFILCSMLNL